MAITSHSLSGANQAEQCIAVAIAGSGDTTFAQKPFAIEFPAGTYCMVDSAGNVTGRTLTALTIIPCRWVTIRHSDVDAVGTTWTTTGTYVNLYY